MQFENVILKKRHSRDAMEQKQWENEGERDGEEKTYDSLNASIHIYVQLLAESFSLSLSALKTSHSVSLILPRTAFWVHLFII